jgi:hypothetical protein
LHRMVSDEFLIAIGDGGRAEPYRYFIHPLQICLWGDKALLQVLDADPGATEALRRCEARLLRRMSSAEAG